MGLGMPQVRGIAGGELRCGIPNPHTVQVHSRSSLLIAVHLR
jgi:hypothetical protein